MPSLDLQEEDLELDETIRALNKEDLYTLFYYLGNYTQDLSTQHRIAVYAFREITRREQEIASILCRDPTSINAFRFFGEPNYRALRDSEMVQELAIIANFNLENATNEEVYTFTRLFQDPNVQGQACETIQDVQAIDVNFLQRKRPVEESKRVVFILLVDGYYSGHIYTLYQPDRPEVTNVVGIRTALLELYSRKYTGRRIGAAPIFMDAIRNYSLEIGNRYILVHNPFPPMIDILGRCGFYTIEGREEQNPTTLRGSLSHPSWLEESYNDDMILPLKEELQCPVPNYYLHFLTLT